MLINALLFIVVFTLLAIVHELGHLIWAKRAGIRVFEFGIGFGPRLFSYTKAQTVYSINLIPVLGFVKIAGAGEGEDNADCPEKELFSSKSIPQKLKTIIAGPLSNILMATMVLVVLSLLTGVPAGISNEIGSIMAGSPAEKAGLKPGDKILAINGQSFKTPEFIIDYIHHSQGRPLKIRLNRNKTTITVSVKATYNEKMGVFLLGFSPTPYYERVGVFPAIYHGFKQSLSMIAMTLIILFKLITGGLSLSGLAGPVGIAQITSKYAQAGLANFLYFFAFLNVNIGILNLLPLPALDGGHILIIIIEAIRRKPLDRKVVALINFWGFWALISLMALVTFNDLRRLFGSP